MLAGVKAAADGLGDEAQQRRLVGACSGGLLLHAMPNPDGLLAAAGVVKVIEQTWRLDPDGPTGNSSARIGERPRIEAGQVQQAHEGEAWLIARGRYEHLMVARTRISEGYRARAHAIVALARSWRPAEALPGARTWAEAQAGGLEALAGLAGHLAIQPPPDSLPVTPDGGPPPSGASDGALREPDAAEGPLLVVGYRLRLAVAAAARDGDQAATVALIREGRRCGLDATVLLAVAARHWPQPRLRTRARQASQRWAVGCARWTWARRPRRRAAGVVAEREGQP